MSIKDDWLSWLERCIHIAKVAGSSPASSTMKIIAPTFRKTVWTDHSKIKMRQYGLSVTKLLGILRKPERCEHGIAPGTTAVMRTNKVLFKQKQVTIKNAWQKPKKAPGEIWVMYKDVKNQSQGDIRRIISAWRYPGVSKPGEEIPIPKDIRDELLLKENLWN